MKKALLIINAQNDYLAEGKFPLWHMKETLKNIQAKISEAHQQGELIILIQHIAPIGSLFCVEGTLGSEIIPAIANNTPDALTIQKRYANAFDETDLTTFLHEHDIEEIKLVGMMTQNDILFTAIADPCKNYRTLIMSSCCTSVSNEIHTAAIEGLARLHSLIVI